MAGDSPKDLPDAKHDAGGHDAPVSLREHDDLQRWPVARAIHRVISTSPSGWATRIGLYGRWGTGKTTVLNFLEELETEANSIVVRFSAWSAVGEAGVIALLYQALNEKFEELGISGPWLAKSKNWVQGFARSSNETGTSGAAVGAVDVQVPGLGAALAAASNFALSKLGVTRDDLAQLIKAAREKGRHRIVVFIDDLDRADPRVLPKTLLALREMLDWPDFTFVLAFDKDVVASALGEYSRAYGDAADRFLEKIIDVPFVLPTPSAESVKRLATRALGDCCDFIPESARNRLAEWLPANPRTAKLVARSLGALRDAARRHDEGEVDWYALGLQSTLRIAAPAVAVQLERALVGGEAGFRSPHEEPRDREVVIDEIVGKHAPSGFELGDRQWLVRLAKALIGARARHSDLQIKYEMDLTIDEPAFTWREFQVFVDQLSETPSDQVVSSALAEAGSRSGKDVKEVVEDLLSKLVTAYGDLLKQLADQSTLPKFQELVTSSGKVLGVIEFFWLRCSISQVQIGVRSGRWCGKLFPLFAQWLSFNLNPDDRSLRDRELRFLKAVAQECTEPLAFYGATDPQNWGGFSMDGHREPEKRRAWVESIRAVVESRVVEAVLDWFRESGGMEQTAITERDDGLGAWLVEDPASPLFRDKATVRRLSKMFNDAAQKPLDMDAAVVRDNAIAYLARFLDGRRGGGHLQPEKRAGFVASHRSLLLAAWRATVSVPHQHRSHSLLRERRDKLIALGINGSALKLPGWLKAAP